MNPAERVERFDEAADAFAADVQPDDTELQTRGGHWASTNKDLWARYFRARARLTESIQHPEKVRALLEQASHARRLRLKAKEAQPPKTP